MNRQYGIIFALLCLMGCSDSVDHDLVEYVKNIKQAKANKLPELPKISRFKPKKYLMKKHRSPFQLFGGGATKFKSKPEEPETATLPTAPKKTTVVMLPKPDAGRPKEYLEKFSLESLRMVGSLAKNGKISALLLSQSGLLHVVNIGDYVGKNSGRIEKITAKDISIFELVRTTEGGWQEIETKLELIRQ